MPIAFLPSYIMLWLVCLLLYEYVTPTGHVQMEKYELIVKLHFSEHFLLTRLAYTIQLQFTSDNEVH